MRLSEHMKNGSPLIKFLVKNYVLAGLTLTPVLLLALKMLTWLSSWPFVALGKVAYCAVIVAFFWGLEADQTGWQSPSLTLIVPCLVLGAELVSATSKNLVLTTTSVVWRNFEHVHFHPTGTDHVFGSTDAGHAALQNLRVVRLP